MQSAKERTARAESTLLHAVHVRITSPAKEKKRTATTARVDFATDAVAKAIDLFGFATKLSISDANRNDVDIFGFHFALTRNRNKVLNFAFALQEVQAKREDFKNHIFP